MTGMDAIGIIDRYRRYCLFRPYKTWLKYDFMYRSYTRWATDEILTLIASNKEDDPKKLVTQFMLKMDDYVECSKRDNAQILFSIARDGARDILEILDKYDQPKGESIHEHISIDPLYEETYGYDTPALAWDPDIYRNQRLCDYGVFGREGDA